MLLRLRAIHAYSNKVKKCKKKKRVKRKEVDSGLTKHTSNTRSNAKLISCLLRATVPFNLPTVGPTKRCPAPDIHNFFACELAPSCRFENVTDNTVLISR